MTSTPRRPPSVSGRRSCGPAGSTPPTRPPPGGFDAAAHLTSSVRLFTHAVSLGGVDSLVQHPAALTHRPVAPDARPAANIVRLSVGLEHPDDLVADLEQALTPRLATLPGSAPRPQREAVGAGRG